MASKNFTLNNEQLLTLKVSDIDAGTKSITVETKDIPMEVEPVETPIEEPIPAQETVLVYPETGIEHKVSALNNVTRKVDSVDSFSITSTAGNKKMRVRFRRYGANLSAKGPLRIAGIDYIENNVISPIISIGSEVEYALWVKPEGSSTFEDVGGNLHRNETLLGSSFSMVNGVARYRQTIREFHSATGAFANVSMTYYISGNSITIKYSRHWLKDAEIAAHYPAMLPVINFVGSVYQKYVAESYYNKGLTYPLLSYNRANASEIIVGETPVLEHGFIVNVNNTRGYRNSAGIEHRPVRSGKQIRITSTIDAETVGNYANTDKQAFAFPNPQGIVYPRSGSFSNSSIAKGYFQRSNSDTPEFKKAGDIDNFNHVISLNIL